MKITAEQIAAIIDASIIGDAQRTVGGFAKIEEAKQGDLSFLANPKYLKYLEPSEASILILSKRFFSSEKPNCTILLVEDAYNAFTILLQTYEQIVQGKTRKVGIEKSAIVESSAKVHENAYVGAMTYIGENASINEGTYIHPQVYIGNDVQIGKGCTINAGVKLMNGTEIGDNVILHAGVVIGSDGFGFAPNAEGVYSKIPQLGTVKIGNDVEIGANTTIDRATMGKTIIGNGVKIDNLVQIAHNVIIEDHTVIAAQAGISGSTKLGKHCIVGGQAGIVGHIELANGTKVNAQSGVSKSVKESNKALTGSPAFDYYQSIKSQAIIRQLPMWIERIKAIEKK